MPKVAGYRALWDLIPRAVQPRMPATAQTRQFKLRGGELDEGQRAVGELGYRYGFFVLAVAATTFLAVALYLPWDRLLGATDRLQWLAIAIAVVYLVWMLPTILVAWIAPDVQPQGEVTPPGPNETTSN